MTGIVQQKWSINRQKNEKAKALQAYALAAPRAQEAETCLTAPVTVYAYNDGFLYVDDPVLWQYPDRIWKVIDQLKGWLQAYHPVFWDELQALAARDSEIARQARVAKIMGAIGNNLDELPELKEELIKLGDKLKKGEDIRDYCKYYGESGSS